MAERGRPSRYRPEIADKVLALLAEGLSLRAICQEPQMPHESTVRYWVRDDREGFAARYARARDIGLDCIADRLVEIAETPVIGEKRVEKSDGKVEITTGDCVDRSRLAVDALKWYLCKMAPKRYGEKLELAGDKEAPLGFVVTRLDRPPPPQRPDTDHPLPPPQSPAKQD